ncbi:hypothetical protein J2S74_001154 [Evansella vedderi]|uniref:Uncharacterized protein n=1 Tax=Evansella vedderi TaxID=38282 RepID=A0ABT9ZSR2_9BACI|nr:hypothetical protein [Evansella vedderi]
MDELSRFLVDFQYEATIFEIGYELKIWYAMTKIKASTKKEAGT